MTVPAETGISEALSEKILAFVEREAGRDAELSPEDEAMVRELLATDPEAQALAADFRDVDTGLKAMFQAFDNMPVSEELIERIRALDVPVTPVDRDEETGKVVTFTPTPAARTRTYGLLAAAASLALIIAGGGLFYQNQAQQSLEQALAELEADRSAQQTRIQDLEIEADSLEERLASTANAQIDAETALSTATSEYRTASGRPGDHYGGP